MEYHFLKIHLNKSLPDIQNSSVFYKNIFIIFETTQASQKLEISSFYTRLRREEEGDLRGVARTHGKDYSSPLL